MALLMVTPVSMRRPPRVVTDVPVMTWLIRPRLRVLNLLRVPSVPAISVLILVLVVVRPLLGAGPAVLIPPPVLVIRGFF